MIHQNLSTLNGKPVQDFDVTTGIASTGNVVYRIRVDYDSTGGVPELISRFCQDPQASRVEELIIGAFDFEGGDSKPVVAALIENAKRLPNLKILFIGDITYEENEISWINQCDMSPLLQAYPALEYFRVRGGSSLQFSGGLHHSNLRHLIIETGGLPPAVVSAVGAARLPALEHLELWLGDSNYGFDSSAQDFATIVDGSMFPRLTYLGLRNAKISDDLARMISASPILNRLEVLDLSMGTLGDAGAEALLANPALQRLQLLDLHHHYISDEVAKKFRGLGMVVNLDGKAEDSDGDRYVQVAE